MDRRRAAVVEIAHRVCQALSVSVQATVAR